MIATMVVAAALCAAGPQQTLTLADALAQAEQKNHDLNIARERLEEARLGSRKVWANYLPQLTVGGAYTRNNTEATISLPTTYIVRDVFQPTGPPFDPSKDVGLDNPPGAPTTMLAFPSSENMQEVTIQKQDQLGAQARVTQAILAPALWPAIQATYIGTDVAELSTENARREILFAVAQLYYASAALKESISVQEQSLELNQKREKDAKVRVQLGTTPKMALLKAEIDRARSEQDLKRAQNAYQSQLLALATLLDRDADFDVTLPPEPEVKDAAAVSVEDALKARPDVAASQRQVDLAAAQRRISLFKYLPNLGVSAQYQWANVAGFTGENRTWYVQVGLNWTLFDGGLREAELAEAGHKVREAELNADKTRANAIAEVKRAALDLDSAIANREKAAEQVQLAKENVQLVTASYDAGAATYLEVADAANGLSAAQTGLVAETLNANLARLRVLKAAGLWGAQQAAEAK